MSLATPPDLTLRLYDVRFKCRGERGTRLVWAPSERSASRVLREHPSSFGLPAETVVVLSVRERDVRERGVKRAA